jgi:hypothetical protein
MLRTQVYLTQKKRKLIKKRKKRHALRTAAGLWADRVDLPDFINLRKELDR